MRILHAIGDKEVPWSYSLKLFKAVESEDVDLVLRKRGNHRLMKSRDLTLLLSTLTLMLQEWKEESNAEQSAEQNNINNSSSSNTQEINSKL